MLFVSFCYITPDWQTKPAAGCALSTLSGRWENEGVGSNDPLPGVVGSGQALRQPPPSKQHDHGQRQNQHHGEYSVFPPVPPLVTPRAQTQMWTDVAVFPRTFHWDSISSSDGKGEARLARVIYLVAGARSNRCPFDCRSKSQRRRFEEELNERMIRTIDGINSQKWVWTSAAHCSHTGYSMHQTHGPGGRMWPAKSCWVVRDEICEPPALYLKGTHKKHRKTMSQKETKDKWSINVIMLWRVFPYYPCITVLHLLLITFPGGIYRNVPHVPCVLPQRLFYLCLQTVAEVWGHPEDLIILSQQDTGERGRRMHSNQQPATSKQQQQNYWEMPTNWNVWGNIWRQLFDQKLHWQMESCRLLTTTKKKEKIFILIKLLLVISHLWANIFTDFLLFIFWRRKEVLSKKNIN